MQQATLRPSLLFETYQAADAAKRRVYALADDDADVDVTEAACDAAYDIVESLADAILAAPAGSTADVAIKARVLLARGTEGLLHYRSDDLKRFVEEVSKL